MSGSLEEGKSESGSEDGEGDMPQAEEGRDYSLTREKDCNPDHVVVEQMIANEK